MIAQKINLRQEIERLLIERIDRGLVTSTAALAEQIMVAHHYKRLRSLRDLIQDDREFYEDCAWHHVKTAIRNVLRDYKLLPSQTPEQLVLPGYEFVQKAYAIEQGDEHEPHVVPIEMMSEAELIAKAAELRQMAKGCEAHAEELDRFRVRKFGKRKK